MLHLNFQASYLSISYFSFLLHPNNPLLAIARHFYHITAAMKICVLQASYSGSGQILSRISSPTQAPPACSRISMCSMIDGFKKPRPWCRLMLLLQRASLCISTFSGACVRTTLLGLMLFGTCNHWGFPLVGPTQEILPTCTSTYDHIIAMSSLYDLSPTQPSLALVRIF